jgi:hypothetical protein
MIIQLEHSCNHENERTVPNHDTLGEVKNFMPTMPAPVKAGNLLGSMLVLPNERKNVKKIFENVSPKC